MATDKNKIIVYKDWQKTFNKLTDDEAGRLIKHFFNYVNDENPEPPDRLTEIAFEPIKQTLKRDLKKWEQIADRNRENGSKGGRPTKPTETQNNPVGFSETQTNPEKPVSVSVRDSVSVSDKEILLKKEPKELLLARKRIFASTLEPFVSVYGKDLINDFYKYWTEPNKSGTKFRQELEKTWSLERRLDTWVKNDFNKNKPNGSQFTTTTGQSNFKGPTMGQRLDEAKRRAKERRMQQGSSGTSDASDEFASYTDA